MLKFILILVLIILVLRLLARLLMPFMLTQVVKKAERNMYERMKQNRPEPEGHINIEYTNPDQKRKSAYSNKEGEFIDFEEIK